jgi:hypothetical protein
MVRQDSPAGWRQRIPVAITFDSNHAAFTRTINVMRRMVAGTNFIAVVPGSPPQKMAKVELTSDRLSTVVATLQD